MTKKEKSWILYDCANSAYALIVLTTILPIYFKDVAARSLESSLSTAYWGYGNSFASLFLALLAPFIGSIADRKGSKKKLFAGFLFFGILNTMMLSTITQDRWFYGLVIYVLSAIGFWGSNIFYDSFLVDVTEDKKMDWVSSCGFALGYIGSTIPFIISLVLIRNASRFNITEYSAMRISFLITGVWWLIFAIPLLKNVKQMHWIETSLNPIKDSIQSIRETIREIRNYMTVFTFLIAYFFYIDGVSTIMKMAVVFGKDIGIGNTNLLVILLVTQIVAFPSALVYGYLAKKFTARKMILTAISVYTGITIYAYFITTVVQYWVLAMLVASSQGGVQALSRSYFGQIIPKAKSAQFFGFYDIFGKFSAVMGPLLVGIVTQTTGSTRQGILSIIVLLMIGGLILLRLKESEN